MKDIGWDKNCKSRELMKSTMSSKRGVETLMEYISGTERFEREPLSKETVG
jgi:hypothetical protein